MTEGSINTNTASIIRTRTREKRKRKKTFFFYFATLQLENERQWPQVLQIAIEQEQEKKFYSGTKHENTAVTRTLLIETIMIIFIRVFPSASVPFSNALNRTVLYISVVCF